MNYHLFEMINRLAGHYDWIDDCMEFFAQDIVWLMLGVLAVLWLTGRESNQRAVFFACLSAAIALIAAGWLISPWVNHSRPFVDHAVHQLVPHAPDPSFPSDHSTFAFSLAFILCFLNRRIGLFMLLLACLTGIARVYVGVHYPGDIAGAILLSLMVSQIVLLSRRKLDPLPRFFIQLYNKMISPLQSLSRK